MPVLVASRIIFQFNICSFNHYFCVSNTDRNPYSKIQLDLNPKKVLIFQFTILQLTARFFMVSMIHSIWPWNIVTFDAGVHVRDVSSVYRHANRHLCFPSLLLSGCFWEHLEIQFTSPHWRIGMGRMSPPLCSLKPDSVLGEPWQAALASRQLYWNALTVTGLEPLLLLTD